MADINLIFLQHAKTFELLVDKELTVCFKIIADL